MNKKRLTVCILALLQFACAETYVYQAPAPVYRSKVPETQENAGTALKTYKYPEPASVEPLLEPEVIPTPSPEIPAEKEVRVLPVIEKEVELDSEDVNKAPIDASVNPAPVDLVPEPTPVPAPVEPPPLEPPPLEPLSMANFSPATLALASEADQNIDSGQFESAGVKIERALRIDPRNAILTYKLATVRLKQEQPRLAEDLAKKAALLAGSNKEVKKRSWLLIAQAKRKQNDIEGALTAEKKAAEF